MRQYNAFCCMYVQEVTLMNVEEYTDLVYDLCLNSGIRRQMDAFRGTVIAGTITITFLLFNQL